MTLFAFAGKWSQLKAWRAEFSNTKHISDASHFHRFTSFNEASKRPSEENLSRGHKLPSPKRPLRPRRMFNGLLQAKDVRWQPHDSFRCDSSEERSVHSSLALSTHQGWRGRVFGRTWKRNCSTELNKSTFFAPHYRRFFRSSSGRKQSVGRRQPDRSVRRWGFTKRNVWGEKTSRFTAIAVSFI